MDKNFLSFLKKHVKLFIFCLITLVLSIFLIKAVFVEPSKIVVHRETLMLNNWNKSHDNLKIVVISDIHAGAPFIGLEKLKKIVELVNKEKPDLVLIPGDFVIKRVLGGKFIPPEPIADVLSGLNPKYGIIAVLGNHDWWYNGHRITKSLENKNITVLENSSNELIINKKPLWIAGILDLTTKFPDIELALSKVKGNSSILMLSHNPDVFPFVPNRVSLTIAGHTHGGQVNLPVLGRLVVPSIHKARYADGHIHENNKDMFVSSGIGTSILPVRYGVLPKIIVLTLKSR